MLESSALFRCVAFALEKIVAPLAMVWFALHWFHVPAGKKYPPMEREAAGAGVTVGFLAAVPTVLLIFYACDLSAKCAADPLQGTFQYDHNQTAFFVHDLGISAFEHWILDFVALVVGGLIGWLTDAIRGRWLKETGAPGKKESIEHPFWWLILVAFTAAAALVSLILYYAGPPYCTLHFGLMWGYISLLIGYRFVAAIKGMTED